MKALITGINGFVGKYLAELLLSKEYGVYGIDLAEDSENEGVSYSKANLLEVDELNKVMNDIKPDLVFHLAGFASVKKSFEQPEICKKVNIDGTENVLQSILNAGINPKILVITSSEVYGKPERVPVKETDELNPISPYGESKVGQEEVCLKYKDRLQIIILRSFPHIGPRQLPIFVTSDFSKQIVDIEKGEKEAIIKVGDIEAKRDFTDVRDMVKVYLLAIEKCKSGEIYNACSGKGVSIKGMLDILLSFSDLEIKVEKDPEKMRPSNIPEITGDNSKLVEATGWKTDISMEKTLKDILDYWRELSK